jgi:hypothetical protein
MQAAESLLRKHPTRSYGSNPAVRCSLPGSEIRAVVMIVVDIISEQPFQMALIHRGDVVQQISLTAFHPALRYTILPRTIDRTMSATSNPYFASRSKIRNLGTDSNGNAYGNCWTIHIFVG